MVRGVSGENGHKEFDGSIRMIYYTRCGRADNPLIKTFAIKEKYELCGLEKQKNVQLYIIVREKNLFHHWRVSMIQLRFKVKDAS